MTKKFEFRLTTSYKVIKYLKSISLLNNNFSQVQSVDLLCQYRYIQSQDVSKVSLIYYRCYVVAVLLSILLTMSA